MKHKNGKLEIKNQDHKIIFDSLISEDLITGEKRGYKHIAYENIKMPDIGRAIIKLLASNIISNPQRDKVFKFIQIHILDENGNEFTDVNVRQCKKRDKDGKLFKD